MSEEIKELLSYTATFLFEVGILFLRSPFRAGFTYQMADPLESFLKCLIGVMDCLFTPPTQSDKLGKLPAGVALPITTGQDACYHYELDPELA